MLKTAFWGIVSVQIRSNRWYEGGEGRREKRERDNIPTGLSAMICSALVFAADICAGLTDVEVKNLRRKEMMGNVEGLALLQVLLVKGGVKCV